MVRRHEVVDLCRVVTPELRRIESGHRSHCGALALESRPQFVAGYADRRYGSYARDYDSTFIQLKHVTSLLLFSRVPLGHRREPRQGSGSDSVHKHGSYQARRRQPSDQTKAPWSVP
jgi:hypothetical protein